MKILIVEDNAILALFLQTIIKKIGHHETETAFTFDAALKKNKELDPDLLLVDINLGTKETGVDLVKKIHQFKSTPVVYITGNSNDSYRSLVSETNYVDYLVKPVDQNKLQSVLSSITADS